MNVLLCTAYWPNLFYMYNVLNCRSCVIEQFENFQKQSFRNRTQILSANGVLNLVIPVRHLHIKEFTKDILIAYDQKWQHQHWHAIVSAYRNSPYFDFFEEDIGKFYTSKFEYLLEYNLAQLEMLHRLLQLKPRYTLSGRYMAEPEGCVDLRTNIHPKSRIKLPARFSSQYYQTFSGKFEFVPNLSILDLIFNTGLNAREYLIES